MAAPEPIQNMGELEGLLNIPRVDTFDLAPFLTAPACRDLASNTGNVPVIVPIPQSKYPSPLAENITPDKVKEIHDHLAGSSDSQEPQRQRSREVWLSWKRAWDLNNNHYIEGRVNPAWINTEYKKQKLAFEAARAAKRASQANDITFRRPRAVQPTTGPYRRIFSRNSPPRRPGRRWIKTGYEARIVGTIGNQVGLKAGRISLVEDLTVASKDLRRYPSNHPTKTYQRGDQVPVIHKRVPLYTRSIEYVAVSATAPPVLVDYAALRQMRADRLVAISFDALPFPTLEGDVSTVTQPPADPLENYTIEYDEVLMKRAIGDLEEVDVDTEPQPRTPVGYVYKIDERARRAPQPARNILDDESKVLNRAVPIVRYKDIRSQQAQYLRIARNVLSFYPLQTQTFETIVIETDTTVLGDTIISEYPYIQRPLVTAGAVTQVDGIERRGGLLEWREVDLPPPKRKIVSHTHTIAPRFAPLRTKRVRKVTFFSPSPERQASPEQGALGSDSFIENVTAPTDIDDPDVMFPTSFDPDNAQDAAQAMQQNLIDNASDSDSDSDSSATFPGLGRSFRATQPSGDWLDDKDAPIPYLAPADAMDADGISGGYKGLKQADVYAVPDDPTVAWKDNIQNTVWRPRRTGEKELRIEIDEEFIEKTSLTMFGGIDCGRIPYPVLRSVDKYFEVATQNLGTTYVRKRVWDEVTGTVFNMPSKPAEGGAPTDDRTTRMKAIYGDTIRDDRNALENNIFALDIRRINRMDTVNHRRKGPTALLDVDQTLMQMPWQDPMRDYPVLENTDAWWVTDDQELKRDVPYRSWPPVDNPPDVATFYTDERLFEEEVENDDNYDSRYFVTNLHGGTLIINGVEIKRGCVAGPLPEFAVIECPGNQVAFWHGPAGRFYGEETNPVHINRWNTLRSMKGFEQVGLTAGQVWNNLIKNRLRRELTGNRLEDDEDWAYWKTAVDSPPLVAAILVPGEPKFPYIDLEVDRTAANPVGILPAYNPDPSEPTGFVSGQDEIEWLLTRAVPLQTSAAAALASDGTIRPKALEWHKILPDDVVPDAPEIVAQKAAQADWNPTQGQRQRAFTAGYVNDHDVAEKAADKAAQDELASKKRKSDTLFGAPKAKKTRGQLDDEQKRAHRVEQAKFYQATEDERMLKEHRFREVATARLKAADPTYTGAMTAKELQDRADALKAKWNAVNTTRVASNLPAIGVNPGAQARRDAGRLRVLLQRTIDLENERKTRVQDRKDAAAIDAQVKQDALDAMQAKADAVTNKRTADEAGLTDSQRRSNRRRLAYDATRPAIQNLERQRQAANANQSRATRVNGAVNGTFSAPGTQPVLGSPRFPTAQPPTTTSGSSGSSSTAGLKRIGPTSQLTAFQLLLKQKADKDARDAAAAAAAESKRQADQIARQRIKANADAAKQRQADQLAIQQQRDKAAADLLVAQQSAEAQADAEAKRKAEAAKLLAQASGQRPKTPPSAANILAGAQANSQAAGVKLRADRAKLEDFVRTEVKTTMTQRLQDSGQIRTQLAQADDRMRTGLATSSVTYDSLVTSLRVEALRLLDALPSAERQAKAKAIVKKLIETELGFKPPNYLSIRNGELPDRRDDPSDDDSDDPPAPTPPAAKAPRPPVVQPGQPPANGPQRPAPDPADPDWTLNKFNEADSIVQIRYLLRNGRHLVPYLARAKLFRLAKPLLNPATELAILIGFADSSTLRDVLLGAEIKLRRLLDDQAVALAIKNDLEAKKFIRDTIMETMRIRQDAARLKDLTFTDLDLYARWYNTNTTIPANQLNGQVTYEALIEHMVAMATNQMTVIPIGAIVGEMSSRVAAVAGILPRVLEQARLIRDQLKLAPVMMLGGLKMAEI